MTCIFSEEVEPTVYSLCYYQIFYDCRTQQSVSLHAISLNTAKKKDIPGYMLCNTHIYKAKNTRPGGGWGEGGVRVR